MKMIVIMKKRFISKSNSC